MRHIAIIGSGPSGYYAAEAAGKKWGADARIDVFDKLPVPYGLIRTGVAPDHQSIKAVARRYEKTALTENVRFVGNVTVGTDVTVPELQDLYDAVIFATGAPHDESWVRGPNATQLWYPQESGRYELYDNTDATTWLGYRLRTIYLWN